MLSICYLTLLGREDRVKLVKKEKIMTPPKIPSIFDKDFKYVKSEHTDVTQTWRKHGWTPPSENRSKTKEKGL